MLLMLPLEPVSEATHRETDRAYIKWYGPLAAANYVNPVSEKALTPHKSVVGIGNLTRAERAKQKTSWS